MTITKGKLSAGFVTLVEKLQQQFAAIKADADEAIEIIEPTDAEKSNGWTSETLTEYVRDREVNSSMEIYGEYAPRPTKANSKYRKLRR